MAEVIAALDVPSAAEALGLVDRLPGLGWAKVGPMLFLREGRTLIDQLKGRGIRVFLDLKWHDIPNSVAEAARAAVDLGVDLATVHALGGARMIEAAVEASGTMRIAAVTVLTSHGPADYWESVGHPVQEQLGAEVARLTRVAVGAGAGAVVASPLEVRTVRQAAGVDRWIVTPGIRLQGGRGRADDQRRTATPEAAVAAGATHLVVGRPLILAADPQTVFESLQAAVS